MVRMHGALLRQLSLEALDVRTELSDQPLRRVLVDYRFVFDGSRTADVRQSRQRLFKRVGVR